MRRISLTLVALVAVATTIAATPASPAGAAGDDAPRGLVYNGLTRDDLLCRGAFRFRAGGDELCSHGPDAAPPGIDVRQRRAPDPGWMAAGLRRPGQPTTAATTAGVQCYGDGSDGMRVQLIYARASNVADRYATYRSSFNQWAAALDAVFDQSAAETGGSRHVRFVQDSSCTPIVDNVVLTTSGAGNFTNTINELRAKGYSRSDRKYLVWVDANVYCGIAQVYSDDSPGQSNYSNGNSAIKGVMARVDNGCWGLAGQSVEAHELTHAMGGVQTSAPHATRYSHCWDESDRMCYADGSGSAMRQICPTSHDNSLDCNHDDYYYAGTPPAGNYLATHWNVANSAFLAGTNGSVPPPSPPPGPTAPSPPQNLTATRPATGGVKLTWQAPSSNGGSAVTGYDVYRKTGTGVYALIKTTPNLTWKDTTTSVGTSYTYMVEAKNSVGVSAPSNEATQSSR